MCRPVASKIVITSRLELLSTWNVAPADFEDLEKSKNKTKNLITNFNIDHIKIIFY